MKRQWKSIILIAFIFPAVIPDMAMAKRAVAWIMEGYKDCKVSRLENGKFEEYQAKPKMPLFPGDTVYKKNDIRSVKFTYYPYCEPIIKNNSTAIILNNAPKNKESIISKIAAWLGLTKTIYKEINERNRGEWERGIVPLENATLMAGRKIILDKYYEGKTMVFKELHGKEVFSKTFTHKDLDFLIQNAGLKQGKTYIREVYRGIFLQFRSTIRVLKKKDEEIVSTALAKVDREKISSGEKTIRKAAYLQMISDLYPTQVDLYWLSFHLLNTAHIEDESLKDLHDVLLARCFDHSNAGITEADFALLDSPGCLVTVELTRKLETNFVPPDFPFKNYDQFALHFQVNFDGYLVVLFEEGEAGPVYPVFGLTFNPFENTGYKVKPNSRYRSCAYRFGGRPTIKNYLFILSDKPLEEMEQYQKLQKKCGKSKPKLLEALSKRAKEKGQKMDLEIMGSKGFTKVPGKSFKGIIWFLVSLEN